ncbi:phosphate/phosphite/phosphonate ABC transporter substrate-binding protein [Loktanella sp. F6476L]|uniref:phosphate/phosphite/phosphonate ABC transporter substrate-binding protein n=1 Tax=Loktanella sp. F6476L TaxID=2926405 RepID=UPI001FF2DE48|nr:phosphate/phosphite/phosphonate ABC transporter substrate-binding protein [Loktanella sp. F6476L]MCK0121804.1 phosphate/phosphite/phosphonate ABC transporter substrate-binding protein [Loktanella sp. F6476L]
MLKCTKLLQSLGLAAFLGTFAVSNATAQETYTFGVVPQFEALRLNMIWAPILEELSAETGHNFEMVGSPNIPEFEMGFTSGDFDFAYVNPFHSIMAMDSQGYTPLVNDAGRRLFGILTVPVDSPIQSVEDLNGKAIAFPAPNALGASLLMRSELDIVYGIDFDARFVATHTSAYLNAILHETDAASGVMGTFNRQEDEIKEKLRILHRTQEVAPHPVVVHPRVPLDVQEAVRAAFLKLGESEEGQALLAQIPIRQIAVATEIDFEPLRDLNLNDYVVLVRED